MGKEFAAKDLNRQIALRRRRNIDRITLNELQRRGSNKPIPVALLVAR